MRTLSAGTSEVAVVVDVNRENHSHLTESVSLNPNLQTLLLLKDILSWRIDSYQQEVLSEI